MGMSTRGSGQREETATGRRVRERENLWWMTPHLTGAPPPMTDRYNNIVVTTCWHRECDIVKDCGAICILEC